MAYNGFTLDQLKRDFGLTVIETTDAFADGAPVTVSAQLREALATARRSRWPSRPRRRDPR